MGPFRRRGRRKSEQLVEDMLAARDLARGIDRQPLGPAEAQEARVAVEAWLESEDHAPMSPGWGAIGFGFTDRQQPESEEDAYAITDALIVGYALWQVIRGRSTSTVPQAVIDCVRAAAPDQAALPGVVQWMLAEPFDELRCLPAAAWDAVEAWAWRHAAGRSADRRWLSNEQMGVRFPGIAAEVDYETAFRVGYVIGCAEAITGPLEASDEVADEVEYVAVDRSTVEETGRLLAGRAIDNVEISIEKWADMLLLRAFPDIVLALRGESDAESRDRDELDSLGWTAARLGWFARAAEFSFLEEPGVNEDLTGALRRSAANLNGTWLGAARSIASALMNISRMPASERQQPAADELLAPVGAGSAVQEDVITRLIAALLTDADGEVAVPGEIAVPEIDACVRYGYYLHSCQSSMPEEAYVELDAYAQPG